MFAVLYDNYFESKRNEMVKGTKNEVEYTFSRSESKEERKDDKNWLKENRDNF